MTDEPNSVRIKLTREEVLLQGEVVLPTHFRHTYMQKKKIRPCKQSRMKGYPVFVEGKVFTSNNSTFSSYNFKHPWEIKHSSLQPLKMQRKPESLGMQVVGETGEYSSFEKIW